MDHFEQHLTLHMPLFGSDNKLYFLMLQNTYDEYITYADNLLTDPLTPTHEKELELILFFTEKSNGAFISESLLFIYPFPKKAL